MALAISWKQLECDPVPGFYSLTKSEQEEIAHAKASETVKELISKAKKKAEKEIAKHRK